MIRRWLQKVLPGLSSSTNLYYLTQKPWVVVKDGKALEKFIFRDDHELLISRKGKVETARWEYLSDINGLLIERRKGRFLYNPSYVDRAAMIWKVDGSESEFVTLANPNLIPNLNITAYLEKLRYKKHNILKIELEGDIWMEVERDYDTPYPVVGNKVTLNGSAFPEGSYPLKNDPQVLIVRRSRIRSILHRKLYATVSHGTLEIYQQDAEDITENDLVRINGSPVANGAYYLPDRKRISVVEGKISTIEVGRSWSVWWLVLLGLGVLAGLVFLFVQSNPL
ncbi:MAG: hypothetical protein RIG62_16845 [Cyclobacteriaceae bacterium]